MNNNPRLVLIAVWILAVFPLISEAASRTGVTAGGASFQPSAPYYAAFFYIWYKNPNTGGENWSYWNDLGNSPPATWFSHYLPDPNPDAFDPANELYSANNYANWKWQVGKLAEARQEVVIASWWGQGTKEDAALTNILHDFMGRADNPYPNLRWAVYYEDEGFSDPDVSTLVSDLTHIRDQFAVSPFFLRVNGKPVVFVYAGAADEPGTMTQRWHDAQAALGNAFYIVLKVFPGYASDPNQPDSWHQYAPALRSDQQAPYAFAVSPGFWLDDGSAVRLARDAAAFEAAVQSMVAAPATWKLVETWNEWGEGTAVEPGVQTRDNGPGQEVQDPAGTPFGNLYVDILQRNLPSLEQGTGAPAAPTPTAIRTSQGLTGQPERRILSPGLADGINDRVVFGEEYREVRLVDLRGREVYRSEGTGLMWSGRGADGRLCPSGEYVARLKKQDGTATYQIIVLVK